MVWFRKLEHLLLIFGGLMLGLYGAAYIHQSVLYDAELRRFKSRPLVSAAEPRQVALSAANPDLGLWLERRIRILICGERQWQVRNERPNSPRSPSARSSSFGTDGRLEPELGSRARSKYGQSWREAMW
jgi:hypothetical protein